MPDKFEDTALGAMVKIEKPERLFIHSLVRGEKNIMGSNEVWATCYGTWLCPECNHDNNLSETEPDAGDDRFCCLSCGTKTPVKEY